MDGWMDEWMNGVEHASNNLMSRSTETKGRRGAVSAVHLQCSLLLRLASFEE